MPKVIADQQIHTKYYKDLVMHYPKIKTAIKKEVLTKHYIRIYAFGEEHIDLKTILNDKHHYTIVDTDLLDKPNIKNEVLIYLMMFPKKFSFMNPITITTFESFELYMQLKAFNCAGEQVEFILDDYEE